MATTGTSPTARFVFDSRGLPPELKSIAAQDAFRDAIAKILKDAFGVDPGASGLDPKTASRLKDAIAATTGILIQQGNTTTTAAGFRDAVINAYRTGFDPYPKPLNGTPSATTNQDLYFRIVEVILAASNGGAVDIAFQELASVASYLINNPNSYPLDNPLFANQVNVGRDRYVDGAPPSESLQLPPLTGISGQEIELEPENIEAVGVIYLCMQMERMRLFDVTDRLMELNQLGLLSLHFGPAAKALDDWYWNSEDRMQQPARLMVFGRVCGMQGAAISKEVQANATFEPALTRFIATLVELDRQERVTNLIEPSRGRSLRLTEEMVRKAGRDLASNASLYGWSGTQLQARRLKTTVIDAFGILSMQEILNLYAASSLYQVIERVCSEEFKQVPNIVKLRTTAEAGKEILRLLAKNFKAWGASPTRPLFETEGEGGDGDVSFEDRQAFLLQANSWVAVAGLDDAQIDRSSQPADTPYMPSVPQVGGGVAPVSLNGAGSGDALNKLRQMMASGNMPSREQLQSLLPAM